MCELVSKKKKIFMTRKSSISRQQEQKVIVSFVRVWMFYVDARL